MEEHARTSLSQLFMELGPIGCFAVAFSLSCTLWLLVSRIRRCFQPRSSQLGRDLAFLFSGPVSAILHSIIQVVGATQSFVRGGIDAEFDVIYGLSGSITICIVGFLCFMLGVIAFSLPTKSSTNVA